MGGLRRRETVDESWRRGQKRREQRRRKVRQQRKQKEQEVVGWRTWRVHGER